MAIERRKSENRDRGRNSLINFIRRLLGKAAYEHVHLIDPDTLGWAPDHSCMEGFVECTICGAMTFVMLDPMKPDELTVHLSRNTGAWKMAVAE